MYLSCLKTIMYFQAQSWLVNLYIFDFRIHFPKFVTKISHLCLFCFVFIIFIWYFSPSPVVHNCLKLHLKTRQTQIF
jgi:hypothetical protein